MIMHTMLDAVSSMPSVAEFHAAKSGDDIAGQIKTFIAPIAAILVGLVGLKYLFGDSRSLAGFISFLLLGIIVYALIMWGNDILKSLGEIFKGWVA